MAKLKKELAKSPPILKVKKPKLKKTSLKKNYVSKDKLVKSQPLKEVPDVLKDIERDIKAKWDIKLDDIRNAISGVLKFRSENPKLQNKLFEETVPMFLQLSCHKVPRGQYKLLRIPLKYPLRSPESETCLIVAEVQGIRNIEHEKHIAHYEKLLQDKGVDNIKKLMTFHEFRTEYETFELKRRLVDSYDSFLVDGRISGKVVRQCGKIFHNKRKVPTPVKLHVSKLKEHIDKMLSKALMIVHLRGNCYNVQFGLSDMNEGQLVENLKCALDYLNENFPGGVANVKGAAVAAPRAPSIPIYMTTKSANDVPVPKLMPTKPKAYKTYKGILTTLPDARVIVKPTGEVIVKRGKNKKPKKVPAGEQEKLESETAGKKSKKKKVKHVFRVSTSEQDKIESETAGRKSKTKRQNAVVVDVSASGQEKKIKSEVGEKRKKRDVSESDVVAKKSKKKKVAADAVSDMVTSAAKKLKKPKVKKTSENTRETSMKKRRVNKQLDKYQPYRGPLAPSPDIGVIAKPTGEVAVFRKGKRLNKTKLKQFR